jgi:hypothetical protein
MPLLLLLVALPPMGLLHSLLGSTFPMKHTAAFHLSIAKQQR